MDVSTIMRFVYNNFHVPIAVGTLTSYNPLLTQIVQFCLSPFVRRCLSQLNVSVLVHQNLYSLSILSTMSNTISVRTKQVISNQQRRRFLLPTHSFSAPECYRTSRALHLSVLNRRSHGEMELNQNSACANYHTNILRTP